MRRGDALEAAIFLAAASVGLLFDGTGLLRMTLCASAAHELGHWTAYVVLARHIPRLRLRIGGLALQGTERLSGGKELGVLAAGPLVNFLLAGLCLAAAARHAAYALYFFAAINLCVAVFNLLPFGKLDGNRLLNRLVPLSGQLYLVWFRRLAALILFGFICRAFAAGQLSRFTIAAMLFSFAYLLAQGLFADPDL